MVKPISDYDFIKSFICDDEELFDRLADDYADPKAYDPSGALWFGWIEDEEVKALLSVRQETSTVVKVHKKTDIEMTAEMTLAAGTEASISAGFDIVLVDN